MVTRDMELVRKIILEIQARKDVTPKTLEIPGYEPFIVARHLEMLIDAGFIDGARSAPLSLEYPIIVVKDLAWAGHDFAAAIENETIWKKIKQSFSPTELATLPLTVLKSVGLQLLTEWAKAKVGLI